MGESFTELRHQSRAVHKDMPARRLSSGGGAAPAHAPSESLAEIRQRSRTADQDKPAHRLAPGGTVSGRAKSATVVTTGKAAEREMRAMEKLAAKPRHKAAGGAVQMPDPSWTHPTPDWLMNAPHKPNWIGAKNGGRQPSRNTRQRKADGGGVAASGSSPLQFQLPGTPSVQGPPSIRAPSGFSTANPAAAALAANQLINSAASKARTNAARYAPAKTGAKSGGRQSKGKR